MRQLFKRFFTTKQEVALLHDEGNVPGDAGELLSLFHMNLEQLSVSAFDVGHSEVMKNGDLLRNYSRMLNQRECRLFDKVELKIMGDENVNVVFTCSMPQDVKTSVLREFVNQLYAIYGADNSNKAVFAGSDEVDYKNRSLHAFFGRNWLDYPKYKYPISLRRTASALTLSIWGLRCIDIQ